MTAFLLIFLIGSQIEGHLLSTGAFEVYLNGGYECMSECVCVCVCVCCVVTDMSMCLVAEQQVWSKLTSGRLPSLGEMKAMLDDFQSPAAGLEPPT